MRLSKHFILEEFECKDKSLIPLGVILNLERLAAQLEVLREVIGKPIHINSGYRTEAYNKSIGGVPGSQHTLGKAADIVVEGMSPKKLKLIIEKLILEGRMLQGGLGLYDTFVHYDVRGTKARWDYRKNK